MLQLEFTECNEKSASFRENSIIVHLAGRPALSQNMPFSPIDEQVCNTSQLSMYI